MAKRKIRAVKMPTKKIGEAQRFLNTRHSAGASNPYGQIPYLMRYVGLDRQKAFQEVCDWVDEYNRRKGITDDLGVKPAGTDEWLDRPMPEPKKKGKPKNPDARPRGWHFKKYFEHQGKVYSKGVEITKASEIKKLKKEAGVK